MIDLGMARTEPERLALSLLAAMETGTLAEFLETSCSDDFTWANSGLPTLHGRSAVEALMKSGGFASEIPILAEMTHFSADVLHLASDGDVAFTERVDHHWSADGRDLMTPEIAGVIETCDGMVIALRDYYDVACYSQQPADPDPLFTREAFLARQQPAT